MNRGVLSNFADGVWAAGSLLRRWPAVARRRLALAALAAGAARRGARSAGTAAAAAPWLLGAGRGAAGSAWRSGSWRRLKEERLARLFERAEPVAGQPADQRRSTGAADRRSTGVEELLAAGSGRAGPAGGGAESRSGRWCGADCIGRRPRRGWRSPAWAAGPAAGRRTCLARGAAAVPGSRAGTIRPTASCRSTSRPGGAEVLYGGQVEVRATVARPPGGQALAGGRSRHQRDSRAIMFLAPGQNLLPDPGQPARAGRIFRHRRPGAQPPVPHRHPLHAADHAGRGDHHVSRIHRQARAPPSSATSRRRCPKARAVAFRVASNRPLKSGTLTLTPVLGGKTDRVALAPERRRTTSSPAASR